MVLHDHFEIFVVLCLPGAVECITREALLNEVVIAWQACFSETVGALKFKKYQMNANNWNICVIK